MPRDPQDRPGGTPLPTVTMPQLGESVAEGTIGKWLKNIGDHVDKYEPIVEVVTDKVNAEVPSPFEGTLTAILVKEGETVPNNAEIAVIEGSGPAAEAAPPAASPGSAAAAGAQAASAAAGAVSEAVEPNPPGSAPASTEGERPPPAATQAGHGPAGSDERSVDELQRVAASSASSGNGSATAAGYEGRMTPAVRRLAREHGVDLAMVEGTGHAGRVTREDVMRFVESGGAAAAAGSAAAPVPAAPPAAASAPGVATPAPAVSSPVTEGDSLKAQSPMRKAIATQMTKALQVPVAYTTIEVDMSGVVRLRESLKRDYQSREGIGLSFVAFVTKAAVESLKRHADFNGHYTDEGLWRRKAINVGCAVAVEDGLIVPVIHDADQLSIHGLNHAIHDLADRARGNHLRLDDIQGGTFTVDNTGWTGSILTQPIINVPEVAILTMESIVKRSVVLETPQGDTLGIRPIMNMCLGFDHRASDGAQAGRFVGDIKRWLESVDEATAIW
jgi:pyruvate/2-oxoglutarate dehydrogenase complex dihydrolipoamide acyltransferase (E2) component